MTLIAEKRIQRVYDPKTGSPLSWREIDVPWLKDAIHRFHAGHVLSAEQIDQLVDYLDYWINAPAWMRADADPVLRSCAISFRSAIKQAGSREYIFAWLCCVRPFFNMDPVGNSEDVVTPVLELAA